MIDLPCELLSALLSRWDVAPQSSLSLLNYSENHTYLVTQPGGRRFCLRVHRPGYQSRASIESELAWLDALRRDLDLPVPQPVRGRDGRLLQQGGEGESRFAVLFEFIEGQEPSLADDIEPIFETLGGHAARLHEHACQWEPPAEFTRQRWGADEVLSANGLWGDWRRAPGVDPAIRPILDALEATLRHTLGSYGTAADRFGLIHADMRLGNLLVNGDRVAVIDFDDAGFCWFAYDFAAAISFHETSPIAGALKTAWLRGYLPIRSLNDADITAMDTMVMLRRMALLAWIGSHNETELAQRHQPGYAQGTAELAERYLNDGCLWR